MHLYVRRIFVFLLLTLCCSSNAINAQPQPFYIEPPRKLDHFTDDLLFIINDAPSVFSHLKGKPSPKADTIHPASKIYQLKTKLLGATTRLVVDSTVYAEFFFGDLETMEESFDAFGRLVDKVSKSLSRRTLTYDYNLDTSGSVVKLQKMAYCANRGFYHYNMSFQIIRLLHNGKFRLIMQVYSGKPQFYYRVMRNEPIGSFNLVNNIKTNLSVLQDEYGSGCPADIPAFVCRGRKVQNDSTFINFQKAGFDEYPNARSEFDVYMTNLRVSLGGKYIYYMLPVQGKGPLFKRIAFIQMEDIEKSKRKTVLLSLVEVPEMIPTPTGFKKQYAIEIAFVY